MRQAIYGFGCTLVRTTPRQSSEATILACELRARRRNRGIAIATVTSSSSGITGCKVGSNISILDAWRACHASWFATPITPRENGSDARYERGSRAREVLVLERLALGFTGPSADCETAVAERGCTARCGQRTAQTWA